MVLLSKSLNKIREWPCSGTGQRNEPEREWKQNPVWLRLLPWQKKWWHWDSFQIGHYCSFWLRPWLQTPSPDLCRINHFAIEICSTPATDAKCTPIELSRTMMMLRKVFHHGMKSGHLNWQMQFMWDGDLQMEHKTFLIGQQEFKILISYTLKLLTPNEKCWVTFLYAFLFPWGISSFLLLYNNFFECFW